MPSADPAMNKKIAPDFARCARPKLCLGEMSITKFEFWVGVCPGCVSGAGVGVSFGGLIHRLSMNHSGWFNDVHTPFNPPLYSVDIDTIIPLNSPSSRLYSGSQNINSMLPTKSKMAVPQLGRRNPGPPDRGRGPLSRQSAWQCTRRGKGRAKHEGRTFRARVWFTRHNSDSRQVYYATLRTP